MAEKYDLVSKVTALIVEQFEEQAPESFDVHASFEELGFDWLAHTELVMRIEEEFSLIISDEDADGLINVHSIVTYLDQKKSAA